MYMLLYRKRQRQIFLSLEQLNSRRKRREQKKREEKKREDKITEEENRLIGIYRTPNIDIESYQEFPQWQPEIIFK